MALFQQGQLDAALATAEHGLRAEPQSLDLLKVAGIAARSLGKTKESQQYWERAKALAPTDVYVAENLVQAYQMAGDLQRREQARAELMKLRQSAPDKKALKPSYTRDEFSAAGHRVVCHEFYELSGAQHTRYVCPVFQSLSAPAVTRFELISQDAVTEKARAQGLTGATERFFMLVKEERGVFSQAFAAFPREPAYEDVREQIVLVLEGKKTALNASASGAAASSNERLVSTFLAAREAFAKDPNLDLGELSKVVRAALDEAETLVKQDNYAGAIKRLEQLEKYRPLREFPSFEVQLMLFAIHQKLGDSKAIDEYKARATAMREVLWWRIGAGDSVDNPARVLNPNEISEWARTKQVRITDTRGRPYKNKEILEVTYTGPSTGNQPKIAYFEMEPRTRAAQMRRMRLFDPLPLAGFRQREHAAFEAAKAKRNRFLDDRSFAYDELIHRIDRVMKEASVLADKGAAAEALAKLRELESIRPLEEIPLTHLLSLYSALLGRVGENQKQIEIRTLIFGVNQVIAHSGDGSSADSAVQVITISEEYAWLNDKGLTRVKQRLVNTPAGKFDVLTARDAAGQERDYYFDVTRVFPRGAESVLGRKQG